MDGVLHIKPTNVYRLSEVAAHLDVSLRTLQRAVEAGELTAVRAGRYSFVTGRFRWNWMIASVGGFSPVKNW